MQVHKIIDALRGRRYKVESDYAGFSVDRDRRHVAAASLEHAEKFDFGVVNELDEIIDADNNTTTTTMVKFLPITLVEKEAWISGLIPLPAPLCWYEFMLGDEAMGLLINNDKVTWISWARGVVIFNNIWLQLKDIELDEYGYWDYDVNAAPELKLIIQAEVDEDRGGASIQESYHSNLFCGICSQMIYLTMMINSKTTVVSRVAGDDDRLARSRLRRGYSPLPAHRVVKIVPSIYLREARREAGYLRLPPRLHWRRSHIRVLYRGSPNERRVLVPRCLVGKAEQGEVSHEYRVVS